MLEYSAIKSAFIFLKKMPVLSSYNFIYIAPKYVLRFVSQRYKNADSDINKTTTKLSPSDVTF